MVALKPTPAPVTTYHYDVRGNRTGVTPAAGPATALTYYQANRLVAYGASATYAYNGDGLRASKTVSGSTTPFTWNLAEGLPLVLQDGTTNYIYGSGGQVLEQITATGSTPISLVGTATGTTSADNNFSVDEEPIGFNVESSRTIKFTLPAGIIANDQTIVAITATSSTTFVPPDGYTLVGSYPSGSGKTTVFRHTATGGETTATFGTSGLAHSAAAAVYRGVDPTTPIDASSSGTATNSSAVSAPSVTTTATDDRLVLVQGAYGTTGLTWHPPASMTDQVHQSDLLQSAVALADQTLTVAGPTGARLATTTGSISATADLAAILIALKPAQGQSLPAQGQILYHHHDQLGSTRALTDANGAVVATYTYDPYGKLAGSTGSASNPFGYAGQYTDNETGLQYLRARYYDPSTAQFLTVDPADNLTGSRYGYTDGNPLNASDPTGLRYEYTYTWNLGNWGASAPFVARYIVQTNPNLVFPFEVETEPERLDLFEGEKLLLHTGVPRGCSFGGLIVPVPCFGPDPVVVSDISSTSFTFTTLPGHVEGAGSTITFAACVDDNGDLIWSQHGVGSLNGFEHLPGVKPLQRFFANRFWSTQARNLKAELGRWNWE